jgi:hypothetical protein
MAECKISIKAMSFSICGRLVFPSREQRESCSKSVMCSVLFRGSLRLVAAQRKPCDALLIRVIVHGGGKVGMVTRVPTSAALNLLTDSSKCRLG